MKFRALLFFFFIYIGSLTAQNVYAPKYTYQMSGYRYQWFLDSIFENQYKNKLLYKQIAYKQNLNTPISRITYTYYTNKKIKECFYETYNTLTKTFEISRKTNFSYSDSSVIYTAVYTGFNVEMSSWSDYMISNTKKDNFGNIINISTRTILDSAFVLRENNNFKIQYLQSSSGVDSLYPKVVSYLNTNYSWGTTSFNDNWTCEFDQYNRLHLKKVYEYSGRWQEYYIDSIDYNNTKNLVPTKIHRRYYSNNSTYTYDSLKIKKNIQDGFYSLNDFTDYVIYYYSKGNKKFQTKRYTVYPDNNGSYITTYQNFDLATNKWKNTSRYYYILNDEKKIIQKYSAVFDAFSNDFIPNSGFKYENYYDINGNLRDSTIKSVAFNSTVFENYKKLQYYDFELLTSIENEEIPKINLYPNPNSDGIFHIDIPTAERIELYNLQGQLIRELKIEDFKIEMKDVPKGLYSLVIYTDKGTSRTKIAIN